MDNHNPIFTQSPVLWMGAITNGNTTKAVTGYTELGTASDQGIRIDRMTFTNPNVGAQAAKTALMFVSGNGVSSLYGELELSAITASSTVAGQTVTAVFDRGLNLPSGYKLMAGATIGAGLDSLNVFAFGGKYDPVV